MRREKRGHGVLVKKARDRKREGDGKEGENRERKER